MIQNLPVPAKIVRFNNLWDGLTYRENCPFCSSDLRISLYNRNYNQGAMTIESWKVSELKNKKIHEKMYFFLNNSEIVTIDHVNNTFISNIHEDLTEEKHILLSCDSTDCSQFNYILKIYLNFNNSTINTFLDKVMISFEDKKENLHEIESKYFTNKTIYTIFNKDKTSKLETGLIPIDVNDIFKSVKKIKKLVAFA